ncbi:MAG: hypothetical protein ACI81T_001003 [Bacteroidia bacterium]|jgi:hypothetical protein
MANGFITLKNGDDFFTRWTEYDMIIEIAISELNEMKNGGNLASFLKTRIPKNKDGNGGDSFLNDEGDFVQRTLDPRELEKSEQLLFWKSLQIGKNKLLKLGKEYSNLNPERIIELLDMQNMISKASNNLKKLDT